MSLIGSNVAQSLAGLSQAEKIEARDKRPAQPKAVERRARKDEYDHVAVETDTAEAVRGLASNDQEEAREDRQEHPQYNRRGSLGGELTPRSLDIQG